MLKEITEKKKEIAKMNSELTSTVTDELKKLVQSLDEIESFRWTQYTPYFNDGDTCEFSLHNLEVLLKEEFIKECGLLNGDEETYGYEDNWKELDEVIGDLESKKVADVLNYKRVQAVEKGLGELSKLGGVLYEIEDGLKEHFGDHTMITIDKKGIETEEYEHD